MALKKWSVVGLLSIGMVIAYVDRANLSVVLATSQVRDAFHLSDSSRGLLNSAFFGPTPSCRFPLAGWWTALELSAPMRLRSSFGRLSRR